MIAPDIRHNIEWTEHALNAAWEDALSRMGVPIRFSRQVPVSLTFDETLRDWQGYEGASEAFPNGRPWAVTFLGPAGTGKTWSAVRLLGHCWGNHARAAWYRDGRARFVSAPGLIREIRDSIGKPEAGEPFETYSTCPCLLIDDLGAERATDFAQEQLNLILSTRYDHIRPTIITCNAESEPDLYARMDPRIADRLRDGRIYAMGGTSLRETR